MTEPSTGQSNRVGVRVSLVRLALLLLGALFFGLAFGNETAADRPNIVFILADDLSWSDLGCHGNSIHDTPNIDRLARQGVRFTQAYAPAPICSASRAAFLTGKTPARLNFEFVTKAESGQQQLRVPLQSPPFTLNLPLEEVTLGEALGSAGYTTGFFGKWHVNQHHEGYLGWSPNFGPRQQGFGAGSSNFGSHPYAYRADRGLREQAVADGTFPSDALTEQAVEFIRRHQKEPFFLYLSHYFVHDPVHSRCEWLIRKYRRRLASTSSDAREARAHYAAMVETLDHLVGQVLDAIDRAGLADRTLIVFTSDNGGHPNHTTNAPLRGSKWNLYEGGIRVPLIARWPGKTAEGTECDTVVHGCDVFDTCCAAAGMDLARGGRDGESLLPVLTGNSTELTRTSPLVWHFPYYHPERGYDRAPATIGVGDLVTSQTKPHSAIRSGDWKLLYFYEDDRVELYNLVEDIAERDDLASIHPAIVDRLRQRLFGYLTDVRARLPSSSSDAR